MKYHYRIIVILILLLMVPGTSKSQNTLKILELPIKYRRNITIQVANDLSPTNDVMVDFAWEVRSDRENNQTFTEPGGNIESKKLRFMDDFFVICEQGEYVRLAKDPNAEYTDLSSEFIDYGWIHKSKLLLWRVCLETEMGRVPRKAMVLNTIETLLSNIEDNQLEIMEFRNAPQSNAGKTGKTSSLFEFFYILKEDNESNMILLSINERIIGMKREEYLTEVWGWAPKSRLTLWDHRVAVEPNWDPTAVAERRRGKRAKFFLDEISAKRYRDGRRVSDNVILWDGDTFDNRPEGEWRRFPVLRIIDPENPDILTAGVMGKIYSSDELRSDSTEVETVTTYDPKKVAELRKLLNDLLASMRNINIVFVIDGTQSMSPYFDAMGTAISNSMRKLIDTTKNDYKFGAVVYRDYKLNDDLLTQNCPFKSSDNINEIISYLRNIRCGYPQNTTFPEAMFFGLEKALRTMSLNPLETNILILVGDAGNYPIDERNITVDNIIDQLTSKKCNFLAFQVHHDPPDAYDDFIEQTKAIIRGTTDKYYSELVSIFGDIVSIQSPINRESNYALEIESGPYINKLFGLPRVAVMNSENLTEQVTNFIIQFERQMEIFTGQIKAMISGQQIPPVPGEGVGDRDTFSPALLAILSKFLTSEQLRIAKKNKIQIYHELTSTMNVRGQKEPLFKKVVLLSHLELGDLVRSLNDLAESTNERESLCDTWKDIMKTYFGDIPEEQIEEENLDHLHEMLTGLPLKSEALGKVRLKDIPDGILFPTRRMRAYADSLSTKVSSLKSVFDSGKDYTYSFRSNEQLYFWISDDLLP